MKIAAALRALVKIATLKSVDDSKNRQTGTAAYLGRTGAAVYLHSPYGVFGVPPLQSLVLTFAANGTDGNLIGIADDPKNRPVKSMKEGEMGVGNYLTGTYLKFDENGDAQLVLKDTLTITTDGGAVVTIGPGGITVTGGDVVADGVSLKTHTHPGDSGGNTGPPN